MLKKILLLSAFLSITIAGHASVTVEANGVTNLVLSSSGTTLANGDLVRIGSFSSTSSLGTSNSFSSLNALFTPVGEGTDGSTLDETGTSGNFLVIDSASPGSTIAGAFDGEFQNVTSTIAGGTQLYLWVFNSSSTGTATQWGIYDDPTSTSWNFPTAPFSDNLSMSLSGVTAVRGSTTVVNGTTDYELANIPAGVPEPSDLLGFGSLVVVGFVALFRRRARV